MLSVSGCRGFGFWSTRLTTQALVVNLVDQKPKQSETHSSSFPQDSESDSESEIELRSTQTSPETTTSE